MAEVDRPGLTLTSGVLQWFVNREAALQRFTRMLAGEDQTRVILVEGPSGIGKTWLLIRLRREAEEKNIPVSIIDFSSGEAFDDLLLVHRLAQALGSGSFNDLNETLTEATELRVVLKVESGAGSGGVTFHQAAEVHGDVAGRDIIKGNIFNLQADSPQTRTIWQERINEAYLTDLERLAAAGRAVLLFDSFELATEEARAWIRNRLLDKIGQGGLAGVQLIISGEQVPHLPAAWHSLAARISLDPFQAVHVRQYLQDKRRLVISEAHVATIFKITGGRPDLVALLADEGQPQSLSEQPDEERLLQILVEGILRQARAPIPETLRLAAVAEWFDKDLLAVLVGPAADIDDRLEQLQGYSFVWQDERGRLRFAPAVRQVLLRTWSHPSIDLRELHTRTAHHFDECARQAADPRLREEFERQAMGHWLVLDERVGRERLQALFAASEAHYRLAECQLLLQRAGAVNNLTRLTQAWLLYLEARLVLARNDYEGSAEILSALLEQAGLDPELHAWVDWSLGQVAAEQGRWVEAINRYESSLHYFRGRQDRVKEGKVMLSLGDAYLQQARTLGGPIQLELIGSKRWWQIPQVIPTLLVTLPFVIYAIAIRRWRLPPLHHGMNYYNWTLARLLLTAVSWYQDAERALAATSQDTLLTEAHRRLAESYYRLGWRRAARALSTQVLGSEPVVTNAYRQAQVRQELAEIELAAGHTSRAIDQLQTSLQVFERYQDRQGQAQTQALLGQAWLQQGQFEQGLRLCRESLQGYASINDQLGIGLLLHGLRSWLQWPDITPEQAVEVEALIAALPEKTYLPRLQDRLAAVMEFMVSLALVLLVVVGLIRFGAPLPVTPMSETWARLLAPGTWAGLASAIVLAMWGFTLGSGLLGLGLILWGARQKLEPEKLGRILISEEAISCYNYRGQEVSRIRWQDIRVVLSEERVLWRNPLSLLSRLWLYDLETAICVSATILWYDALKRDIEVHLQRHGVQPIRRQLNLYILRSWPGLLLALCPILLGLGSLIVWNLLELPLSVEAAAFIGPALIFLGIAALVVGPYWWLAAYPLWLHYTLWPRSRAPFVFGSLGLVMVAFASYLSYWQPYFPIRHWLDMTLHPLGFLLILAAPLWVVTDRDWGPGLVRRAKPVYSQRVRAVAAVCLLAAMMLTAIFGQRALAYGYVLPMVTHLYRDDHQGAINRCTRMLAMDAGLADAFFFRALAYSDIGQPQQAVADLSQLIDSPGVTITHYRWYRAQAYHALQDSGLACADLKSALNARQWRLSNRHQQQALGAWQEWRCDRF